MGFTYLCRKSIRNYSTMAYHLTLLTSSSGMCKHRTISLIPIPSFHAILRQLNGSIILGIILRNFLPSNWPWKNRDIGWRVPKLRFLVRMDHQKP